MSSQTKVTITHDKDVTVDLKHHFQTPAFQPRKQALLLKELLQALAAGIRQGSMDVTIDDGDAVAASGTIAFSGAATANDTVLINGVTFTAVASGATGNQWNVGASATATAANLAAAITASVTALVSGVVTASASNGTLTITAAKVGNLGNLVTIAKGVDAGPVMTVSGARLTGGTDSANGTTNTYKFGV